MSPEGSIYEGKTLDDAVRKGLDALGLSRAEAMITVLAEGKGGFLGIGSRPFKVRVQARPGGAMREPEERGEGRGGRERERDGRRGRGGRERDGRRGGREERRGPAEAGRREERRGSGERPREEDRPREGRGDRPREGDRPAEGRGEPRPAGERGERGRGGRGGRGGREERGSREPRPAREERAGREGRESREPREGREGREPRPAREDHEAREARPAREGREAREPRPAREEREGREPRPAREEREGREPRPAREGRPHRPEGVTALPPAAAARAPEPELEPVDEDVQAPESGAEGDGERGRRRRRGRRGGRGRRRDGTESPTLPGVVDDESESLPSFESEAASVLEAETTTEVPMIDDEPLQVATATVGAPEVSMSNDTLAAEGRRVTEELLRHMGFDAKVEATAEDDRVDVMATVSADEELLNGRKGETRQALQQLLNRMVNKGGGSQFHLQLEINDFWKDRETELAELAKKLAEDALSSNSEMVTEYLNSQERRIIHMTLREDTRVKTYALGTGMIKRLAVAPADFAEGPRDEE